MFASRFAALLQRFFVQCASFVWIRPHANHAPVPEHNRVIGLRESDERPTILAFGRSGEHQTRGGNITQSD
jgi:hypothetical protein